MKKRNLLIISVTLIVIIIVLIMFLFNPFIKIKINNKKTITINYNEKYIEYGATAKIFNNNLKVKITGKVNTNKIGTYKIKYIAKKGFITKTVIRKVNVVDKIKPIISLIGEQKINLCPTEEYNDLGYTATDNYDKDITKKVKLQINDNDVTYTVKDSSNNETSIKREITRTDTTKPTIKLTGGNIYILKDSKYEEKGFSATDNCDKDITKNVKVINKVNTKVNGTYNVTYTVKDSANNETSVTRKVTVYTKSNSGGYTDIVTGPTYIKGILIVNKKYSLPSTYAPGVNSTARNALTNLQNEATKSGYNMNLVSAYRSYSSQKSIYNNYVRERGQTEADKISARPGHSEHQTGLAFDVGELRGRFGSTPRGIWLKDNCHRFGFIIRYPQGKENITGYAYEPWHIRYVGVEVATSIMKSGITLEEYLGV